MKMENIEEIKCPICGIILYGYTEYLKHVPCNDQGMELTEKGFINTTPHDIRVEKFQIKYQIFGILFHL